MALGDTTYRGVLKQASAIAVKAVTPSDTEDFPDGMARGLLVGTAGAATILPADGGQATLIPLQAGYNWIAVRRVFLTGLTAANIWALY
jgi:hypothetical protein